MTDNEIQTQAFDEILEQVRKAELSKLIQQKVDEHVAGSRITHGLKQSLFHKAKQLLPKAS